MRMMIDPKALSLDDLQSFDPGAKQRSSGESRYRCPFCDDGKRSRNLSVNSAGLWKCHKCQSSGLLTDHRETMPTQFRKPDLIYRPTKPVQAEPTAPPTETAKSYDIAAEYKKLTPIEGTPAEAYLKGRGISLVTANAGQVRFTPGITFKDDERPDYTTGPGVVFPLRSIESLELIGMSVRMIGDKKMFTLKAKDVPYIYVTSTDVFDNKGKPAIITEAQIDALSIAEAAMMDAIATVGSAFPDELAKRLKLRRVYLAHDNDEPDEKGVRPGDAAAQRAAVSLNREGCTVSRLRPERKDWNDDLKADPVALRSGLLSILGDPFD